MPLSAVNVKGQVTLPLPMRIKYGINPKDRVLVEDTGESIVIRKAPNIFDLKGTLGKALSPEKEREAAIDAATRHVMGKD